jgi:2'-5' RNA ligase
MEKAFQLPGLHMYEYLLVLNIPGELRERIEEERSGLTEKYSIDQPRAGRPNISLVRFSAMKMMEERIVQKLQLIAAEEKPFVIDLQDYGGYPMHAIFIRIANQQRVLQFIKKLKQGRRLMKAAGEEPYFLQDPVIALAGRISKEKYVEAMKEYLHKKFSGKFVADSFILLKRAKNETTYQVVRRFGFQLLQAPTAPVVLFQ